MRTLHPIAAGLAPVAHVPFFARVRAAWFVPDMAVTVALVALFYVFFLWNGSTALFRDSDAGWHIRAGEQILRTGSLPTIDPWSFSKPAAPWITWEWGADLITALIHREAGLSGVAAFYGLAIAAAVWMWFRLNWAAGGNFLIACALAAPLLSTTNLHWLARPHVLGWLFLLTTAHWAEKLPSRDRKQAGPKYFIAALLLGTAWANIHGSFILGPLILTVCAAGQYLTPKIWNTTEADWRSPLTLAAALTAGTVINPHGWNLHTHVLTYLTNTPLLDRIGEFQSFNFHAEGASQITLALLIGILGGAAALATHNLSRFLLAIIFTAAALRSARMLPVAALILLPMANGTITQLLRNANVASGLRRALNSFLAYGDRLRLVDTRCGSLAAIPVAALLLFTAGRLPAAFPADQFPVKASAALEALPATARIFSPDKFGGYLIYQFAGTRRVFFDGRSDFYGAEFLKSYARIVQVRPGWQEAFGKWNFSHALLPSDYSLIPALKAEGWTEIYRDKTAILLTRPLAHNGATS